MQIKMRDTRGNIKQICSQMKMKTLKEVLIQKIRKYTLTIALYLLQVLPKLQTFFLYF